MTVTVRIGISDKVVWLAMGGLSPDSNQTVPQQGEDGDRRRLLIFLVAVLPVLLVAAIVLYSGVRQALEGEQIAIFLIGIGGPASAVVLILMVAIVRARSAIDGARPDSFRLTQSVTLARRCRNLMFSLAVADVLVSVVFALSGRSSGILPPTIAGMLIFSYVGYLAEATRNTLSMVRPKA